MNANEHQIYVKVGDITNVFRYNQLLLCLLLLYMYTHECTFYVCLICSVFLMKKLLKIKYLWESRTSIYILLFGWP